jgi:hypothetical protein
MYQAWLAEWPLGKKITDLSSQYRKWTEFRMSETSTSTIYLPEDDAPKPGALIECRIIGTIRTPYKRMEDRPSRHNSHEHLLCTIRIAPEYATGLIGLESGSRTLVLSLKKALAAKWLIVDPEASVYDTCIKRFK